MKIIESLRSRILVGALAWTLGLFLIAGAVLTHLIENNPIAPAIVHHFFLQVGPIAVVAAVFLVIGLSQIRRGVSPVSQLRHKLSAVHRGHASRVDGTFPSEVQALVDDLNNMLTERDHTVSRAQAKAGDLAHGLKTPLAILQHEADEASRAGHAELAVAISQQVDRMRRQIDYHLAHARAAASGKDRNTRSSLGPACEALFRTLHRLHADRQIALSSSVDPSHAVRAERADLDEMLGNLLDNACKWTRSQVSVTSRREDRTVMVTVDDDGPGVDDRLLESVLQRGVRADETAPGSGFGLAIVRDLAEVYGGSIELRRSTLGGLCAELRLPAAADE